MGSFHAARPCPCGVSLPPDATACGPSTRVYAERSTVPPFVIAMKSGSASRHSSHEPTHGSHSGAPLGLILELKGLSKHSAAECHASSSNGVRAKPSRLKHDTRRRPRERARVHTPWRPTAEVGGAGRTSRRTRPSATSTARAMGRCHGLSTSSCATACSTMTMPCTARYYAASPEVRNDEGRPNHSTNHVRCQPRRSASFNACQLLVRRRCRAPTRDATSERRCPSAHCGSEGGASGAARH